MTVAAVTYPPPVMSRFHPWRALGRMKHVVVEWTDDLPDGIRGDTDGRRHIRMARDLLQVERRVTVTHEQIHIELRHEGCQDERTELLVRREAARRLITIYALGEALAFHGEDDMEAIADELWVDVDTLRIRLDPRNLHPAERHYLRRRLERRELGA